MSVFIDACRKRPTPYTPIWLMRQAGRYQPEYRAIRAKTSFVEMCKSPDLATEVTLLPVTQLGVDAAILFADILLILEPLGVGFEFTKEDGPTIPRPIRQASDVDRVADEIRAADSLGYVMQTIRQVRAALPSGVPLIGFAGAPFTLASYAIEGGGSKNYLLTKQFMHKDPAAWDVLMSKFVTAIADYLNAQIAAGAQAIQVFDSWVGCLGVQDYRRFVQPHMKRLFSLISADVPRIHFGTGNPALYPLMREAGGDVIGIDWRCELGATWRSLEEGLGDIAIMGNLDPAFLIAPVDAMRAEASRILGEAKGRSGHVFNLGHGVFPEVQVDQVRALVDHVHAASAR